MLHCILFCSPILVAISCQSKSESVGREEGYGSPQKLKGAWKVVSVEMNGRKVDGQDVVKVLFIFEEDNLTMASEEVGV